MSRSGLPQSLASTLSALANHPGGGTVILGLDEATGLRPVQLPDPHALKQGLAHKARSFSPPVQLTISEAEVDGVTVIVAKVHGCDPSAKPCRITASGTAYVRGSTGTSHCQIWKSRAFLAARKPPLFDRRPVTGATREDLDDDLVPAFLRSVRERDPTRDGATRLRCLGGSEYGASPTSNGN
ncbi:ATP-binding protein [Nonomuraea diastatica]|uniref:AlbA family DNA-binding domain-containing protein n=1 Tax=Nonomuraea diastatica TaxID=1848329 RepID=UPI001C70A229